MIEIPWYGFIIGYIPFLVIIMGIVGNFLTFVVLRTSRTLKNQSSMVVFSYIAILDSTALFTWNLDTYFRIFHDFEYENLSLVYCRLMVFLQYFGIESSALLLSFISIDRYFTIASKPGSIYSRLPFGTSKTSFIWSSLLTIFIFAFNSHILVLNGQTKILDSSNKTEFVNNSSIHCYYYSPTFSMLFIFNTIQMTFYSIVPVVLMIIFNSLIIYKTACLGKYLNRNNLKLIRLYQKKRRLTISLIIITFMFLLMSLPSTIFFAFFFGKNPYLDKFIGGLFDDIAFLHHASLFISLFLTNVYFRKAFCEKFKFWKKI